MKVFTIKANSQWKASCAEDMPFCSYTREFLIRAESMEVAMDEVRSMADGTESVAFTYIKLLGTLDN